MNMERIDTPNQKKTNEKKNKRENEIIYICG